MRAESLKHLKKYIQSHLKKHYQINGYIIFQVIELKYNIGCSSSIKMFTIVVSMKIHSVHILLSTVS